MPPPRSIAQTFATLRSARRLALMPFIPAGYPDLATTKAVLPALEAAGASLVEIGIPFSDPIADGPVVQESFAAALSKKLKLSDIFQTISEARPTVSIPLVAMVSYSIVYAYGLDHFLTDASKAGFNGLILPDLPPPEAQAICQKVNAAGLDTVLLIAPTTSSQRRKEIAALTTGFIYYLSLTGITGERQHLPADLAQNLQNLRTLTDKPLCVGFGISKPEHVAQLKDHADGAIVGSAVVRRMQQHATEGPQAISAAVASYCRELLGASS